MLETRKEHCQPDLVFVSWHFPPLSLNTHLASDQNGPSQIKAVTKRCGDVQEQRGLNAMAQARTYRSPSNNTGPTKRQIRLTNHTKVTSTLVVFVRMSVSVMYDRPWPRVTPAKISKVWLQLQSIDVYKHDGKGSSPVVIAVPTVPTVTVIATAHRS